MFPFYFFRDRPLSSASLRFSHSSLWEEANSPKSDSSSVFHCLKQIKLLSNFATFPWNFSFARKGRLPLKNFFVSFNLFIYIIFNSIENTTHHRWIFVVCSRISWIFEFVLGNSRKCRSNQSSTRSVPSAENRCTRLRRCALGDTNGTSTVFYIILGESINFRFCFKCSKSLSLFFYVFDLNRADFFMSLNRVYFPFVMRLSVFDVVLSSWPITLSYFV